MCLLVVVLSREFEGLSCCAGCVFFFFKQKTAYELRISDWSSDVCSSDLLENLAVDASAASGDGALIAVAAGVAPNYSIAIENVSVRGPGKGRLDGIAMAPGTFADDVTIANSDFAAMGIVVLGTGEQAPKGW